MRRTRDPLEAFQLLTAVGKALSAEKDPDRLMELILLASQVAITWSKKRLLVELERARAEAAASRPPVLDRERTLSLCAGDPELAREMVDLLLETAGGLVAGLHDAVAAADADAVHRRAHALKGAAANVGGGRIEATARRLMAIGQDRDLDRAAAVLTELDDDLARLEWALTAFRHDLGGGAA